MLNQPTSSAMIMMMFGLADWASASGVEVSVTASTAMRITFARMNGTSRLLTSTSFTSLGLLTMPGDPDGRRLLCVLGRDWSADERLNQVLELAKRPSAGRIGSADRWGFMSAGVVVRGWLAEKQPDEGRGTAKGDALRLKVAEHADTTAIHEPKTT